MKARYIDLPLEKLPHRLHFPEKWPTIRGTAIEIDPHPVPPDCVVNANCEGPHFNILNEPLVHGLHLPCTCIHLIELDESALDAEIERLMLADKVFTKHRQLMGKLKVA